MKSIVKHLSLLVVVLPLAMLSVSCQKERVNKPEGNRLVPYETQCKETSFLMIAFMGHNGKNCPGCVLSGGVLRHVDCQGAGNECLTSSRVALQEVEGGYILTTLDTLGLTSEDFCNMPARSLQYAIGEDNYVYLNIPPQLVFRDTATLQFSFTGITFSEGPVYSNE